MEENKRVQRKKIEQEIRRLNNLLTYSRCDNDEIEFIKNNIKFLEQEIGFIK